MLKTAGYLEITEERFLHLQFLSVQEKFNFAKEIENLVKGVIFVSYVDDVGMT